MVTVLILLIFKSILLSSLLFFSSCSLVNTKVEKKVSKKEKSLKAIKKTKQVIFGPTLISVNNTFKDVTQNIGLAGPAAQSFYAIDFNNDGHTDLVTLAARFSIPTFFQYLPENKKFKKIDYDPFGENIRASFLVFADFDKDGVLDMLVGVLNQKTELTKQSLKILKGSVKNSKVSYSIVHNAFPSLIMPTSSVSLLDYDLDGHLDIYVGNWFSYKKNRPVPQPDRLFKGKVFTFKDISGTLKGEHEFKKGVDLFINARPTFGVSSCDIDQNGYPDILTSSSSGHLNKLWLNLFNRKNSRRQFVDYGVQSGYSADQEGSYDNLGGGSSFYSICTDYNNDEIMDIGIGEIFHSYDPETRDRSSILTGATRSFPPKFIRTEFHMDDGTSAWSQGDRRGVWFDYNYDGFIDLMIDNSGFPPKSRLILFEQGKDHSFGDEAKVAGVDILNPSGSVILDFNNDGREDIITGQTTIRNAAITPRIFAFKNTVKLTNKRILKITLRGQKANTRGIGALLTLKTSKRVYTRWSQQSYGSLPSQNAEGLYFGLSEREKPISVKVRWPIIMQDKSGRKYPLVKNYKLNKVKLKRVTKITLCENGKVRNLPQACPK